MSKVVLVTGATGKQGGALVDALVTSQQASDFTVLAVTRNPDGGSAKKLASKSPLIKIVKGDFADIPALFKTASEAASGRPIWGVYSVQTFDGKGQTVETEEQYGKAMVDASIKAGVKQFVYSSVERGGNEESWNDPTPVPHFASKHRIEHHLRDKAGDKMAWTILRPVAFMDNFEPGFGMRVFLTMLHNSLGSKPLQFVAVSDIGKFGARAFIDPAKYRNRAIGLAGDELSVSQFQDAVGKQTGSRVDLTFGFLGSAVKIMMKEMGIMSDWFASHGYGIDIAKLNQEMPMKTTQQWLATESKFTKA